MGCLLMIQHVLFAQFDCNLYFLEHDNQDEAIKLFYKKKQAMLERLPDHRHGWVQHHDGDIYLWCKDRNLLVHELVHVAFSLCELRCIKPDEEFIAYTTQYAFRELT